MKLSNAALGLATVGGLAAVGAGLVVMRLVARSRNAVTEPPAPDQLIGTPKARLSAAEAAEVFETPPDRPH